MNYSEKLKDPKWQRKRLEILSRDNFTCQKCNSNESELHVHHRYYVYKNDPWDYPNNALVTLCFECHEEEDVYKGCGNDLIKILQTEKGFLDSDINDLIIIILNLDPTLKKEFLFMLRGMINIPEEVIKIYKKCNEWPELER